MVIGLVHLRFDDNHVLWAMGTVCPESPLSSSTIEHILNTLLLWVLCLTIAFHTHKRYLLTNQTCLSSASGSKWFPRITKVMTML